MAAPGNRHRRAKSMVVDPLVVSSLNISNHLPSLPKSQTLSGIASSTTSPSKISSANANQKSPSKAANRHSLPAPSKVFQQFNSEGSSETNYKLPSLPSPNFYLTGSNKSNLSQFSIHSNLSSLSPEQLHNLSNSPISKKLHIRTNQNLKKYPIPIPLTLSMPPKLSEKNMKVRNKKNKEKDKKPGRKTSWGKRIESGLKLIYTGKGYEPVNQVNDTTVTTIAMKSFETKLLSNDELSVIDELSNSGQSTRNSSTKAAPASAVRSRSLTAAQNKQIQQQLLKQRQFSQTSAVTVSSINSFNDPFPLEQPTLAKQEMFVAFPTTGNISNRQTSYNSAHSWDSLQISIEIGPNETFKSEQQKDREVLLRDSSSEEVENPDIPRKRSKSLPPVPHTKSIVSIDSSQIIPCQFNDEEVIPSVRKGNITMVNNRSNESTISRGMSALSEDIKYIPRNNLSQETIIESQDSNGIQKQNSGILSLPHIVIPDHEDDIDSQTEKSDGEYPNFVFPNNETNVTNDKSLSREPTTRHTAKKIEITDGVIEIPDFNDNRDWEEKSTTTFHSWANSDRGLSAYESVQSEIYSVGKSAADEESMLEPLEFPSRAAKDMLKFQYESMDYGDSLSDTDLESKAEGFSPGYQKVQRSRSGRHARHKSLYDIDFSARNMVESKGNKNPRYSMGMLNKGNRIVSYDKNKPLPVPFDVVDKVRPVRSKSTGSDVAKPLRIDKDTGVRGVSRVVSINRPAESDSVKPQPEKIEVTNKRGKHVENSNKQPESVLKTAISVSAAEPVTISREINDNKDDDIRLHSFPIHEPPMPVQYAVDFKESSFIADENDFPMRRSSATPPPQSFGQPSESSIILPLQLSKKAEAKSKAKRSELDRIYEMKSQYRNMNQAAHLRKPPAVNSSSKSTKDARQPSEEANSYSSYQSSRSGPDHKSESSNTTITDNGSVTIDLTKDTYAVTMVQRAGSVASYKSVFEKSKDGKEVEVVLVDEEEDDLASLYSKYNNNWASHRSGSITSNSSNGTGVSYDTAIASEVQLRLRPNKPSLKKLKEYNETSIYDLLGGGTVVKRNVNDKLSKQIQASVIESDIDDLIRELTINNKKNSNKNATKIVAKKVDGVPPMKSFTPVKSNDSKTSFPISRDVNSTATKIGSKPSPQNHIFVTPTKNLTTPQKTPSTTSSSHSRTKSRSYISNRIQPPSTHKASKSTSSITYSYHHTDSLANKDAKRYSVADYTPGFASESSSSGSFPTPTKASLNDPNAPTFNRALANQRHSYASMPSSKSSGAISNLKSQMNKRFTYIDGGGYGDHIYFDYGSERYDFDSFRTGLKQSV